MSYRLKNSDFKPFLGIFDKKVSDLWVYVGESIGVYFEVFLLGENVPRGGVRLEMECKGVSGLGIRVIWGD